MPFTENFHWNKWRSCVVCNQRFVDVGCNKSLTRNTAGIPCHPPGSLRTMWPSPADITLTASACCSYGIHCWRQIASCVGRREETKCRNRKVAPLPTLLSRALSRHRRSGRCWTSGASGLSPVLPWFPGVHWNYPKPLRMPFFSFFFSLLSQRWSL